MIDRMLFTMPPGMRSEPEAALAGVKFEQGFSDTPIASFLCPESVFNVQGNPLTGILDDGWRRRLVLIYADTDCGHRVYTLSCQHDQTKVIVAHVDVDFNIASAIAAWKKDRSIYSRVKEEA